MKKPTVLVATAVSAVVLAGAAGVGIASADPAATPTPVTSATPSAEPSHEADGRSPGTHPHRRDLSRRALHGEVTLGGEQHRVVTFQRGTVSAVSGSSVTVRSVDGFVGTYAVGPATKVRVARQEATIGEVATGDRVRVVARQDGGTATATRIVERKR